MPPDGMSILQDAFGAFDPPAETAPPEVPVDASSTTGTPPEAGAATSETPATPAPETPAAPATPVDIFSNPMVQRTVDQQVKARMDDMAQQQKLAAYNEWLNGLDDDSYGKVVRQQQAEVAKYTSTRDTVAGQFAEQATRDVLANIKELGTLSADEAAKVDPMNKDYKSYGQWVSAVADVVADRRAEARAAKRLKDEVEAQVTERMAALTKQYPKQPVARNGAPAGDDLSKMSGTDLLRSAFA